MAPSCFGLAHLVPFLLLYSGVQGYEYPNNGFIIGDYGEERLALRVTARVEAPAFCTELTVKAPNVPLMRRFEGAYTPEDKMNMGRPTWRKRNTYIFFLNNQGEGTWIIGEKPGVDSGISYVRVSYPTLVPPEEGYMLLDNNSWRAESSIHVFCSGQVYGESVMAVEFATGFRAVFSPSLMAGSEDFDWDFGCESQVEKLKLGGLKKKLPHFCEASFFNVNTQNWEEFKIDESISALSIGGAVYVDKEHNDNKEYVYVSTEHIEDVGWRLTIIHPPTLEPLYPMLGKNGNFYLPTEYNEDFYDGRVAEYDEAVLEIISLDKSPTLPRVSSVEALKALSPGQWVWIFLDVNTGDDVHLAPQPKGLVLELKIRKDNKLIFSWHSSDRAGVLHRRAIDRVTGNVIMDLPEESSGALEVSIGGRNRSTVAKHKVLSALPLNTTAIDFIREYLREHEGMYGLSSCFMYHSGVSLPEPFVYAAEILCVLSGAKPIAMVQYTSPSDDETVYPFVSELCEHIIAHSALLGEAFPVDWKIFRYVHPPTGADHETLIIFRKEHENLVDALRPEGNVAQALHILPFPRNDHPDRERDLKEQLFLSYWNGVVLGYPPHIIEVYIRNFNTELNQEARREQMIHGKAAVEKFFEENGIEKVTIGKGIAQPVAEEFYDTLPVVASVRASLGSEANTCKV